MNRKIQISVLLGILAACLMLSIYPFRCWNGTYSDCFNEESAAGILQISHEIPVRQKLEAQEQILRSAAITLETITDRAGDGCLTVTLSDENENILFQKELSYRSFTCGKPKKIKIGQECRQNKDYILELLPSAETYCSVKMAGSPQNAPASNKTYGYNGKNQSGGLAAQYDYGKYFNKIQILMIWMILAIAYAAVAALLFQPGILRQTAAFFMKQKTWKQIWVVLMLVSIFNLNACLSSFLTVRKTWKVMLPCAVLWLVTGFITCCLYRRTDWKQVRAGAKKAAAEHKEILLLLILCAVVRIGMFQSMPKWDAGEYYYRLGTACRNYRFTFQSFFENFRLCTHSNLGFSFMMGIAEFLSPRNPIGVYIWNLILTLFALYGIYFLSLHCWMKGSKRCAAAVAMAVSVTPIFLGTSAYVNVDYALALFFIYVLYFEYRQEYVLMAFCVVLLSQTKETGVIVAIGYFGMKIFIDFLTQTGGLWKRITGCLQKIYLWIAAGAGAVYGLLVIKLGGFSVWVQNAEEEQSALRWSDTGMNCFGFRPEYIAYKMKQFFILNFAWILVIVITASLVILVWRTVKGNKKMQWRFVLEITGVMAAFALFSVLYVTYTLARYNILFAVLLAVLAFCLLYHALEGWLNQKYFYGITGVLCVLLSVQSFWNMDVVSNQVFQTVSAGGGHTMLFSSYGQEYFGDGLVTNYQYHWIDQAYNKLLKDMNYHTKQGLILTRRELQGTHINGNPSYYEVEWDPVKRKRVISSLENRELEKINVFSTCDSFSQLPYQYYGYHVADTIRQKSALVFVPYYEEEEDAYLNMYEDYCYIAPGQSAGAYGGEIKYYPMLVQDRYRYLSLKELKEVIFGAGGLSEFEKEAGNTDEKSDFEDFYQYLCAEGWSKEKVREYCRYRMQNYSKIKEAEENRDIIKKMDIITMRLDVYDSNHDQLTTEFVGNCFHNIYRNITVGTGSLLKEVDQALIGAEIGKTIHVKVQIPDNYQALPKYAGQELHFVIKPTKITGVMEYDSEKYEEAYEQSLKLVWGHYRDQAVKKLLLASVNSSFVYDEQQLENELDQIDQYMELYFAKSEITQKEFLENYLKVTEQQYETLKTALAQASIRADQIYAADEYEMYAFYSKGKDGYWQGEGIYSDGWMTETGSVFITNTKKHSSMTIQYYAPDFMDGETISLWKGRRRIKQQKIRSGMNQIFWNLGKDSYSQYYIKTSSTFNPKQEGTGEDERDLSILIKDIKLK